MTISVIIPTCHRSALLAEALRGLIRTTRDGAPQGFHSIGVRTPLPDQSVDVVLNTAGLRGLWHRWNLDVLAEARRIGREARALGLDV
ncbi:hypothetical protein [Actinoplanes siamensis]|uniref:Uncharacterized protein n=1 Tax=Actinoplanes siamensis TaxID=1223317 RepID=A0A919N9Q7_9ACTN|nr:hypothetical protein [Actinoplanes siamensis]GIF06887.1 hypothetical protein Asi03nite_44250 [Actinoplanes siamensis]